jgi:hypothetical protein
MQIVELTEVTGKSSEKYSHPRRAGSAMQIRPLSSVLPKVSPIHDLLITTNQLHRADRIYGIAQLVAITTLATSLVYTFALYVSAF